MATIYEHIEQNKRRTWLLVLLFPVTFAVLTYAVFALWLTLTYVPDYSVADARRVNGQMYASYYGETDETEDSDNSREATSSKNDILTQLNEWALAVIPICWGVAMVWMVVAWLCGDKLLLSSARAIPITRDDLPEIYGMVENIAITRGLPMPEVYIINDSSLNAFATGRDPYHASVALTAGIVKKLERAELEGVIAHEMAHVENRDIRLMLMTVAGISFFTLAGEIMFRLAAQTGRRGGKNSGQAQVFLMVLGVVFFLYGYLIAPLIRLAVSRTREYQADATAALTTRNPAALASALRKIAMDSRVESLDDHASMAAMCIANPLEKWGMFSFLSNLTATHPPIESRIYALMDMDGRV